MKYGFCSVVALLLMNSALVAQESKRSKVAYLQELREKGQTQEALEYLSWHRDDPLLAPVYRLELARTFIDLSLTSSPEERQKWQYYADWVVRKYLEEKRGQPESALGLVEKGRLTASKGKLQLRQAKANPNKGAQEREMAQAQATLLQAEKELNQAMQIQDDYLDREKNFSPLTWRLRKARLQAHFELGLNTLELAETYFDSLLSTTANKRAQKLEEAGKIFAAVYYEKGQFKKEPETSLLAVAWVIHVYNRERAFDKAKAIYQNLMRAKGSHLESAQRWARYFHLHTLSGSAKKFQDNNEEIVREAESWLNIYPDYKDAPEGLGVRLELAQAYFRKAQKMSRGSQGKSAMAWAKRAQTILAQLKGRESDIKAQAEQSFVQVSDFLENPLNVVGDPKDLLDGWKKRKAMGLKKFGGNEKSEAAVAHGLNWLIRMQSQDGSWSLQGPFPDKGKAPHEIAGTAFGLLPFLSAGYSHKGKGVHTEVVKRGLLYLSRKQNPRTGDLGGNMYEHALGTMALVKAYGLTNDPPLRVPAQKAVNYLVVSQHAAGGWRYTPNMPGDASVTGWVLQALWQAKQTKLDVPDVTFQKAIRFLASCQDKESGGYSYLPTLF